MGDTDIVVDYTIWVPFNSNKVTYQNNPWHTDPTNGKPNNIFSKTNHGGRTDQLSQKVSYNMHLILLNEFKNTIILIMIITISSHPMYTYNDAHKCLDLDAHK